MRCLFGVSVRGHCVLGGIYEGLKMEGWAGRNDGLRGSGRRSYRGVLVGVVRAESLLKMHSWVYLVCPRYWRRCDRLFEASGGLGYQVSRQASLTTWSNRSGDVELERYTRDGPDSGKLKHLSIEMMYQMHSGNSMYRHRCQVSGCPMEVNVVFAACLAINLT
jgi:hypothetical protein